MNVFITGASSGIGAALAREFAARGATLGLLARRADVLEALITQLPGHHQRYVVDVADRAGLIEAARQFDQVAGGADVVIANAGISTGTLTGCAEDLPVFDQVLTTNFLAVVSTFHPFVTPMRRRGHGTLAAIASVAGVRGVPGAGAYCASKAALITYCESLRVELRGSGVRVVTIAPGFIDTAMTKANPYPMPFLMDVDRFARQAAQAILAGTSYRVIPWQMAWLARVLRIVPNGVFDRIMQKRARKPRAGR
ncbi:MAG TPA: SDR family oxidoreductase [Burkholderiaceae bacterium]|nr:SDR family oxidoreductase [Burkholderiaceae bacterium]